MNFRKYQGLGNDYIVVLNEPVDGRLTPRAIRQICDRHYGVGADGILVESPSTSESFAVRIFNPDGSEAEKSGNGLRIFARSLWDDGRVAEEPFSVSTRGGVVTCEVRQAGSLVFVEMGTATFESDRVPLTGPSREAIRERISAGGEDLRFTGVSVGNPHCVLHLDEISADAARRLGPLLESHPCFPERTNVQLVKVLDPNHIEIEIWERGAGYTLASGSSSCAAAAASVRLGLCSGNIRVSMPGGSLEIGVGSSYSLSMLGPVGAIAEGVILEEVFEAAPQ